jgi:hypothetical protein
MEFSHKTDFETEGPHMSDNRDEVAAKARARHAKKTPKKAAGGVAKKQTPAQVAAANRSRHP